MNRIRKTREDAKISQAALHRHLGWKQSRLANYESGARTPSLNDSRAIVTALNELGAPCRIGDVFPEPESEQAAMPVQMAS